MFNFSAEDKNLVAFVSLGKKHEVSVCTNALILIPGLTDGFMSMSYSAQLSRELSEIDYSLVQVQISSSFMQFGFSSIQRDCKELTALVLFLRKKFNFERLALLGHSTGAQDSVYFLRHSSAKDDIQAVILQGAVGDRDIICGDTSLQKMSQEAMKLREEGKQDVFLQGDLYGAPVTARRFLSLSERLSAEDMFSMDLTESELGSIFGHIRVPISLCFSAGDEYISDSTAQQRMTARLVETLKASSPVVECRYYEGDHGLTEVTMYAPFVKDVVSFLKRV